MADKFAVKPVRNGLAPPNIQLDVEGNPINQGPKTAQGTATLSSNATTPYVLDLKHKEIREQIDNIQTMFVDNVAGSGAIVVRFGHSAIAWTVPGGYQGILPVWDDDSGLVYITRSDDGAVPLAFFNVPQPYVVWAGTASAGSSAVSIADGADVAEGSKGDTAVTNPALSASVIALLKGVVTLLAGGGGGGPATIADGADVAEGAKADAAITNPASSGTVIAFLKGLVTLIAAMSAKLPAALGQGTMAQSVTVVVASDQSTLPVSLAPITTGGVSTYSAPGGTGNALLTNGAIAVKASAGSLYGFNVYNSNVALAWVQFFDLGTGSVTLGTTVPKFSIPILPGASFDVEYPVDCRIAFATAITVAATTTSTGNTAPSAGLAFTALYK